MKATVNEKKERRCDYPCLKIYNATEEDGQLIVLFTEEGNGFPVVANRHWSFKLYKMGSWTEEEFTPFNGTITLSND